MQLGEKENCKVKCFDCISIMRTNVLNCHANNVSMQQNFNVSKNRLFFTLCNNFSFSSFNFWDEIWAGRVFLRCGSQLCTHHQKETVAYASSITGWNTAWYRLAPLPRHNTHTLQGVCTVTLGGRKSNEWDAKLCLVASCVNHTHR